MKSVATAFEGALREARLSEAAHLDALLNVKDAKSLRLMALREKLMPLLTGHADVLGLIELKIQSGETPRLWLDLISSVVMEPDSRTFRLEQEREQRREILFETQDLDEMAKQLLRYVAHRVIAREKAVAAHSPLAQESESQGYGLLALSYIWLTGFVFGVAALLSAAIYLGKLRF